MNRADSSPPAPALISRMTSLSSDGSRGTSSSRSFSVSSSRCFSSSLTSAAKSGSAEANSRAVSTSSPVCFQERYVPTMGVSSA